MANSNFYTMTPYSTWAMPKLDWNLIYGAGAIQQARGDKAEQKYSDFVDLYDNLKLHEKYNESYQNWRTQTDTELDNLINNHGGKLGTTGFTRDLNRLIESKKNDPWIKNAIQSSEQAKLYEENVLRNPDIKPYNDPNAVEYLSWLEDSTPTFKYKGFHKDAPPSTWFANKAKEYSPEKWTEYADFGLHGTLTIQHDRKDAGKITKGFEELKEQFNKTPEGEQLKRMYDAGEFADGLTYDQVFAAYAKGAANVVAYDNTTSTASKNIDQEVERELDKLKKENEFKQQQLNIMKQNANTDAEYKRRMAAVSERNAATNEAETAYKMMYGTNSSGGVLNNAAADELVLPLVVAINTDPDKFNDWRNGKAGNKFKYTMNALTGGANSIENKILENVYSGKVTLKTTGNKELSTAPINQALEYVGSTHKLGLNKEISLVREDQGDFSVQVGYETPLLTATQRDEFITEYNENVGEGEKLKESDFIKIGSSYKLTMVGTDNDLKTYFQEASGARAVKGSSGTVPNNLNFSSTTNPSTTQQTNTTSSNTTPTSTQTTNQQQAVDSAAKVKEQEKTDSSLRAQELAKQSLQENNEKGRFVFMNNTEINSKSPRDFGLKLKEEGKVDFSYTSIEGEPAYSWDGNRSVLYEDAGQTFIGIMDAKSTPHKYTVENVEKYKTPENLVLDSPAIKDRNFEVSFIRNTGNDQKTVYIAQKSNGDRITTSMEPGEIGIVYKAANGTVSVFKAPSMDKLLDTTPGDAKQAVQEEFIKEHSEFERVLKAINNVLSSNNK